MAIIAITQHLGARGVMLGELTAKRLGYRLITGNELVAATSKLYSVTPEQLVVVDERRPHFWERLKTDTQRFIAFVRAVALKEMANDRLVVVGRSVAQLMPDCGVGLRVRLVGPLKERVHEVISEEGLSPAVAERRVHEYDYEVRARIQTLFGIDIDDPAAFNLVVNTFTTPLDTLSAALASCAEEIDRQVKPDSWILMRDLALAAEVRAALMYHPKIGHAPIEVRCSSGDVHVNGPGLVPPWDNLVHEVIRQVDGVRTVEIIAEEQPSPVRPN